jgi:hypothetical protein
MTLATHAAGNRRGTAKKLVGTVAVLSSAAAMAGLATFGDFAQTTTPVDTAVDSGVVSIALTPAAQAAVPYVAGGLLPGDSNTVAMDLVNDGNVDLSSVTLKSVATLSSVLDSDPVNGLQMNLRSCSQAWDVVGPAYSCAGSVTNIYSGRVVLDRALPDAAGLRPGAVDHLLATVSLPTSAGNAYQNAVSSLRFIFTGVQRGGGAR